MAKAEVETGNGRIRGTESGGIREFRGVPYAAPLEGERRFLPPQSPEAWTGTRDASRPGPAPPQVALPVFSWINLSASRLGEDCLTLNVWTPGLQDGGRRPVMVWIHGGGFLVGSGTTPIYAGRDLSRRGDAVIVTINYRLGALGYAHLGLALGEGFEQTTNLGVRDQIAALEWVRDNIESFGGDPQNVTVFGQSAGGMSIASLLGSPRARALMRRAICMSGAADHVIEADEARRVASIFLSKLGGPPPSPSALARIPIDRVLHAQHETMNQLANWRNLMVFLPVVDGDVIPEQPLQAIRRGDTAHIPVMTGTTLEEWKLFRLLDGVGRFRWSDLVRRMSDTLPKSFDRAPDPRTAAVRFQEALGVRSAARRPSDVWSAFQTARVFFLPSTRLAEAQHAGGGAAYSYLFTWRPPTLRRAVGSCHALDIPFVFGATNHPLARPFTGMSPVAGRLGRKMQQAWLRFAQDGDPSNPRLPAWPQYDPENRATMVLGRDCTVSSAPLEAERKLLESWTSDSAPMRSTELAATGG